MKSINVIRCTVINAQATGSPREFTFSGVNSDRYLLVEFMAGIRFMKALITEKYEVIPIMLMIKDSQQIFSEVTDMLHDDDKKTLLSGIQGYMNRNGSRL